MGIFYPLSSNLKLMQSLTWEDRSHCEQVRLPAPLPLCLFSPGVMQTPFHRQNILCRSCQSVYPQAWVPIWGLTSNIENWPAAPTAFPAKRPHQEWGRERGEDGGRDHMGRIAGAREEGEDREEAGMGEMRGRQWLRVTRNSFCS